jgi:hypothetical protein
LLQVRTNDAVRVKNIIGAGHFSALEEVFTIPSLRPEYTHTVMLEPTSKHTPSAASSFLSALTGSDTTSASAQSKRGRADSFEHKQYPFVNNVFSITSPTKHTSTTSRAALAGASASPHVFARAKDMIAALSSMSMSVSADEANSQLRVYVQYAIMYTSPSTHTNPNTHSHGQQSSTTRGRRYTRVHNLCLFGTHNETTIFKNVDACAVTHTLAQVSISNTLSHTLDVTRQRVYDVCMQCLYNYRVLCSAHSPKNHLILPESLRLLPLYVFALLKHPG